MSLSEHIDRLQRVLAFQHHVLDWLTVFVAAFLFALLDFKEPFHRMFSLDDRSLQHPFTEHERVPNVLMLVLAIVIPTVSVFICSLITGEHGKKLYLIHVSVLGLATSFTFNGFITNLLKVWIGRPRPDLLARCIPAPGTPLHELVTISVCTTTDIAKLTEGFKSAPSGHSSICFATFGFLALWLCGQLAAIRPGNHTYKLLIVLIPIFIASYIAISRTEDYRHHPTDVMFGSLLGMTVAFVSYRAFFPSLSSVTCGVPHSANANFRRPTAEGYETTLENLA